MSKNRLVLLRQNLSVYQCLSCLLLLFKLEVIVNLVTLSIQFMGFTWVIDCIGLYICIDGDLVLFFNNWTLRFKYFVIQIGIM